jgi:hypothetical protein
MYADCLFWVVLVHLYCLVIKAFCKQQTPNSKQHQPIFFLQYKCATQPVPNSIPAAGFKKTVACIACRPVGMGQRCIGECLLFCVFNAIKTNMDFIGDYYYIIIILNVICLWHCISKRNEQKWIWIILFLPLVGCIVYFFSEIVNKNNVGRVQSGVGALLNPTGRIRDLEEQLHFADTFNNRVALADAYLAAGQTEKAVALYEKSLTGTFAENEAVNMQLIYAYYQLGRYNDVVEKARKIYKLPQFLRSRAHTLYAVSLGYIGAADQAEQEFKQLNGRFANFEARYQYALLMYNNGRVHEAQQLLTDIVAEGRQLSSFERRTHGQWINEARAALRKLNG